jgi:hypothetical protein
MKMLTVFTTGCLIFSATATIVLATCNGKYLWGGFELDDCIAGPGTVCIRMEFIDGPCELCRPPLPFTPRMPYSHCAEISYLQNTRQSYFGTCDNGVCSGGEPYGDPAPAECVEEAEQNCP